MAYKRPRTFVLTSSRKHLGKAVARGSRKKVAAECFTDPIVKNYLVEKMVRRELNAMCAESSNSVLRSKNVSCMKEFTWDKLLDEMKLHAPMLLSIATLFRV